MKYLIFLLTLISISAAAQDVETDSTLIIAGDVIDKNDALIPIGIDTNDVELFDTLSIDSLVVFYHKDKIHELISQKKSLKQSARSINSELKTIDKTIDRHKKKIRKTKNKGYKSTLDRIVEADELGDSEPDDVAALKRILKSRNYTDADALGSTYRRTSDIGRVATELGLDTSGSKATIAKRIFNFINQ